MKKNLSLVFVIVIVFILGLTVHAAVPQIIEKPLVLTADTVWTGDFLVEEEVDLNGFTLTVDGNLVLLDKSININNGKLLVKGDFRIQNLQKEQRSLDYKLLVETDFQFCNGKLKMDNDKDYVLVGGNFYPNGKDNVLRNGIVELKGNFMFSTKAYMDCYDAQGKHKTIFSGSMDQRVFFSRSGSQFNILSINKKSGKMIFESSIDFSSIDEDTTIPVGGNDYLYLYLYSNKTLSLKGHMLTIEGNLFLDRGEINIDGGSLIVKKDFRFQSIKSLSDRIKLNIAQLTIQDFASNSTDVQLTMKNPKDYILVEGNCIMHSKNELVGLRAGTIELKGDFSQIGNSKRLLAYDTHKVILSGVKKQVVSFNYPSYLDSKGKLRSSNHFNILQLNNKDVIFATKYWANKLIPFTPIVNLNGNNIKFVKYSPVVINGVIYFEVAEINKLLSTQLIYSQKANVATGKYITKNLKVKGFVGNKVNYIQAEELLKQMSIKFTYDPEKRTLFITK